MAGQGDKKLRQARILDLLKQRPVASQSEIVTLLRDSRIDATQASISRDIRELGLIKMGGTYVRALQNGHAESPGGPNKNELIDSITPAGANLIVVRTPIGAASIVAAQLDRERGPDIVGTIAGDDTIFIAVLSRAAQGRVMSILRSIHLR